MCWNANSPRDTLTHKSTLPWIERVFAQGGTRVDNFYVRAISLSTPSWSLLDTGQHLQIRGNAEFDRYTGQVYDYINFSRSTSATRAHTGWICQAWRFWTSQKMPLLIDRFPYPTVYQGFQLYQRGVRWETLKRPAASLLALPARASRRVDHRVSNWAAASEEQTERELIQKLSRSLHPIPGLFHRRFRSRGPRTPDPTPPAAGVAAHRCPDRPGLDRHPGQPARRRPLLVVVSDHGMNTRPGVYSQGYDLVDFFNSRAGGAHHVVTNRHPLMNSN